MLAVIFGCVWPVAQMQAAKRTWSGSGGSELWSLPANWVGSALPGNGDEVVFGGSPVHLINTLDFSLSLAALSFAPDSQLFETHVAGTGGQVLTFTGLGIENLTGGGGPIRQAFTADAGAGSGTILFTGSSGVNLGDDPFLRPVDLTAAGGSTAGAIGGRVIFQGTASTGTSTFTALIADGATIAGAGGGEVILRGNAIATSTAVGGARGGTAPGAAGGQFTIRDNARMEGNITLLAGSNGGLGGRLTLYSDVTARTALIRNDGAFEATVGSEGLTQLYDDAHFAAFAQNFAGGGAGFSGGRMEFHNRASFTSTGLVPDSSLAIFNSGSYGEGAQGGRTVFFDDSFIAGSGMTIVNRFDSESLMPGARGGATEFRDGSRAGSATIFNEGAAANGAGTLGGSALFMDNASAEAATLENFGGSGFGAPGGTTVFTGSSFAADATLIARSGTRGGLGGRITFLQSGGGGRARAIVEEGGVLEFTDGSRLLNEIGSLEGAGTFLINNRGLSVGGNGRSAEVSGAIEDSNAHVAPGTFPGGFLQKIGAGILTLSGASSVTSLSVLEGGLTVNGTFTASGGFASISSGAMLGGSGTIFGALAVANGGIVAPGSLGGGTLTVGPLTLGDTSILNFQLGGVSDRIDVNGALTLDGTLNLSPVGAGLTAGVYRLLNYTGAFTDNTLSLGTLPAGTNAADFSIRTDIAGQVNLVLNGSGGELLFWDGPNVSANGVVNGGSGTWNNTATNWTNSAGTVNQPWASKKAVFLGSPAGVAMLGESLTVTGVQFVTNGYVIDAAAGRTITLAGTGEVRAEAGASALISVSVAGGAFTKEGDGRVILSNSNSYSGGTTVKNGTLTIGSSSGLGLGTGPVLVSDSATSILRFEESGSAGAVAIANHGATLAGALQFSMTSTAGTSAITNFPNPPAGRVGAFTVFSGTSRGASATILNLGAETTPTPIPGIFVTGAGGTSFNNSADAGSATITNTGGAAEGMGGGTTSFNDTSRAGTSTIISQGATVAGAFGGFTFFGSSARADSATLRAEGGTNGGFGGRILFLGTPSGDSARVVLTGSAENSGLLDISGVFGAGASIGSLEGNGGLVTLGSKRLTVGANNAGTTFGGGVEGVGGALTKVGTGTLALTGASSYTGGTSVSAGVLQLRAGGALASTAPVSVSFGAEFQFFDATSTLDASMGNGGRLKYFDAAKAGSAEIFNFSTAFEAFFVGSTLFSDDASAQTATITNVGSTSPVLNGGATAFEDLASAGSATITNESSIVNNARRAVGSTSFIDSATAGSAQIFNLAAISSIGGGGLTEFGSGSSAGNATITSRGATVAGSSTSGGVEFAGLTAGTATFINEGATVNGGLGGRVFFDSGNGGSATFRNLPGTNSGALGGSLLASGASLASRANLGNATIENRGSTAAGARSGTTSFQGFATAGGSHILNARGGPASGEGGRTTFTGTSIAGTSVITNQGAQNTGGPGVTEFASTASADAATFFNGATLTGGTSGGRTRFFDSSRAGTATFDNEGATVSRANAGDTVEAGEVNFRGSSTADAATIINRGKTVATGVTGGTAVFFQVTKAGTAKIVNEGSAFASSPDPAGGWTRFLDNTSAEQSTITNRAALSAAGVGGTTHFNGVASTPTADRATITNEGGIVAGGSGGSTAFLGTARAGAAIISNEAGTISGALGGSVSFATGSSAESARLTDRGAAVGGAGGGALRFDGGTAGNAVIVNEAGAVALAQPGTVEFRNVGTSAGTATITNLGGAISGAIGGATFFSFGSSAGTATITASGGSSPAAGGARVVFNQNSTAAAATLIAEGGTNGGIGGTLLFAGTSAGGNIARIVVHAGGSFDISNLNSTSLITGSIEGAGNFFLGNKLLLVGENNRAAEVSGVIADNGAALGVGGRLYKVGTGPLTLSGANTYTGGTTIGNGFVANSGKLIAANLSGSATGPGPVVIQRGGTLSGSGRIGGPVTLQAGGVIIPGDPVTLTLESSLTWDGGSTIRLALGPTQAGSDRLEIGGALIRGDTSEGAFTVDLQDFGAVVGQTYDFLHFGSIQGFTPADFTFTGAITGNLFINNGTLGVVVTHVPEPSALWLLSAASALLFGSGRPTRG